MKYRKKPIVIEAIQFNGTNFAEVRAFAGSNIVIQTRGSAWEVDKAPKTTVVIYTLEGKMKVDKDDYIIQGIKGEFYPCKPDIFEATYEKVKEDE